MPDEKAHLDRERAESFGATAELYDRGRLPYPDALFDELAALRPRTALDVGCGTGRAARPLIQRGLSVLGVEVDERMARVARGHGVPVEVAAFESWDDAGRQFDLITCGEAWHWLDPELSVAKAAKVLRPGGTIARFWSYNVLREPLVSAVDAIYERLAPDAYPHAHISEQAAETDSSFFADSGAFEPVEERTYWSQRTLTTEQWVLIAETYSDHQRLGPDRLAVVLQALRETIDAYGGTVLAGTSTFTALARRAR